MLQDREQIKKDVVDQLYWDARIDAADVNVNVEDGQVELSGTVPTFIAWKAAQRDAYSVPGVKNVDNNLELRYLEPMPSDNDLELRVRNTLSWSPGIDSTGIDVNVEVGVVTLEGTVDSFWKKLHAADLAMNVGGVLEVVNNLAVTPTESFVDETIAKDVVAALERNYAVDAEQIDVRVENGFVTLNGTVPGGYSREAVYRAALNTPGVIGVEDNLLISW